MIVESGNGGAGGSVKGGVGMAGGAGGSVGALVLQGFQDYFNVSAGSGGAALYGRGGAGGYISGLTGQVDNLDLIAGAGGDGNLVSGTGGAGGSISSVNLSAVADFVHLVVAGNGGNGEVAGAGGSVSSVVVAGAIGDFTSAFDVLDLYSGMGGLVAGLAGSGAVSAHNGSVTSVTADGIAAIIAGQEASNSITAADAVTKISGLHADEVGADTGLEASPRHFTTNSAGTFDWMSNSGHASFTLATTPGLSTNDVPIDGFVLVDASGVAASSFLPTFGTTDVTPLKLITVA